MRVKVIILVVLLGAFGILAAANINLISESLLSLGDVSGFVQYGNYALFYGGDRDLSILDLSAGASVYPIATFDVPVAEYRCNNVYIWGSNAYLVYPDKIHIVSLANIHNPVLQATFSPSAYYRVLIQNRYLYNISSTGILSSYSLNNPLQPELLDTLDTGMLRSEE
ncbi:MAG: hypothetical protein RBS43_07960, partial [Candidatus Cloacimonas sp.]|nr:hypothetical protein [Candidatus Cloacimonas sp.]